MELEKIKACLEKHYVSAVTLRREIHANPETANKEKETTERLKRYLKYPGIEIEDFGLETGLCALVRGATTGKNVLLRADIDALPFQEKTVLPFRSINGSCHCCGHDIHSAVGALCARVIADMREELCGSVRFLFQPAEETITGAKLCVEAGILEREPKTEYALSLHCSNFTDAGKIALRSGSAAAGSDNFVISVIGKGGHVVHPQNSIDPVTAACDIVMHLRSLLVQEKSPFEPAVLGIGSIHGGNVSNAIPDLVTVEGTLRTFDTTLRDKMILRIKEITEDTARSYGARGIADFSGYCPPVIHDETITEQMAVHVSEVLGKDKLEFMPMPAMGSEDFAFFGTRVPILQIRLGTGSEEKGGRLGVHNPAVTFREDAIRTGALVLSSFILKQNM